MTLQAAIFHILALAIAMLWGAILGVYAAERWPGLPWRVACMVLGHSWGPIRRESDPEGEYEERRCQRCARIELWCGGSREGWGQPHAR